MTAPEQIWNRAALEGRGRNWRRGDQSLAALLLAHGLVMNGGVRHAVSAMRPAELAAAAASYRFFGFGDVAVLFEGSPSLDDDEGGDDQEINALDQRYWESVPDDTIIFSRFECM
jgi:hypothetical protein